MTKIDNSVRWSIHGFLHGSAGRPLAQRLRAVIIALVLVSPLVFGAAPAMAQGSFPPSIDGRSFEDVNEIPYFVQAYANVKCLVDGTYWGFWSWFGYAPPPLAPEGPLDDPLYPTEPQLSLHAPLSSVPLGREALGPNRVGPEGTTVGSMSIAPPQY